MYHGMGNLREGADSVEKLLMQIYKQEIHFAPDTVIYEEIGAHAVVVPDYPNRIAFERLYMQYTDIRSKIRGTHCTLLKPCLVGNTLEARKYWTLLLKYIDHVQTLRADIKALFTDWGLDVDE